MARDETLRVWGENIRLRREALGMDQKKLAQALDPPVTQSTISRWEAGWVEPRRDRKVELARVLYTDVRLLFPLMRPAVAAS